MTQMGKILRYGLLLIGILVGSVHLWLGLKAMFVFRNDEQASMWTFMLAGPLSTLPASIIAFFWPKIGATWLIGGSALSFIAAVVNMGTDRDFQEIMWYFTSYSAPMLVLGIAALLMERDS